jgi:hypothetical protein
MSRLSQDSERLRLLAAFLYCDAGYLRFRDRLRIERCLFRIAAAASRRAGVHLLGLDEARNRMALRRGPRSVIRIVAKASQLKVSLAVAAR